MRNLKKKQVTAPTLNINFWCPGYAADYTRQRMTTAEWRAILLDEKDKIIRNGDLRRLVAKRLGAGDRKSVV